MKETLAIRLRRTTPDGTQKMVLAEIPISPKIHQLELKTYHDLQQFLFKQGISMIAMEPITDIELVRRMPDNRKKQGHRTQYLIFNLS